jgi:hypothetical protein
VVLRRWLVLLALGGLATGACSGGSGDTGPTAEVTAPPREPPTTTEALTPEEEVEAAYLRSWDVYAKAVRELDPSGLEESYAGEQLQRSRDAVESYRQRNVAVRVRVEHDYRIVMAKPTLALVHDRYRNHSVLVDPQSGEPTEPDPNDVYSETYTLQEIDGTWKVTDIARAE